MYQMAKGVQSFFRITPMAILGDTAYGHGKQRKEMLSLGIPIVAPAVTTQNPTGLYDISCFPYDRNNDVYICPNSKKTVRKTHSPKNEGWQYKFSKADCNNCPLREKCTTNKLGRSVFQSDYYDLYEAAKAYNETEQGQETYKLRLVVERKNQELKNDCGLGKVCTKSKAAISIKAKLAAITVNLKLTVRKLIAPKPGFIRHAKHA